VRVHRKWRSASVLSAIAALAVAVAGCGREAAEPSASGASASDPGITDTTVKLGSSYALSGPVAPFGTAGKAIGAYFEGVNARRGVEMADGKTRKVEFTLLDDGYEPPRAQANARKLVDEVGAFALFGTLGQETNQAIGSFLQPKGVPDPWMFGVPDNVLYNGADEPWTTDFQLPYATESALYASYLKENMPDATVAILYQGDAAGEAFVEAFRAETAGAGIEVVETQTYDVRDATIGSQIANLAQSKADVLYLVSSAKPTSQALAKLAQTSWRPFKIVATFGNSAAQVLKPAGEIANGSLSLAWFKDPADPLWSDDPDVMQYTSVLEEHGEGLDPANALNMWGFGIAQAMEETLKRTGTTRKSLTEAVFSLDGVAIPALVDGVTLTTGPNDPFPIESAQPLLFENGRYKRVGEVASFEGKTEPLVKKLGLQES
jgi:branched-chain amino acid transport system substrate-binding protein